MSSRPFVVVMFALGLAAAACGAPIGAPGTEATSDAEVSGDRLFRSLGCSECHSEGGSGIAPSLHGMYGEEVLLEGGETVLADEAYLRESILSPTARVVSGYPPIMPSFQDRVTEAELAALLSYIRSLAGD